MININKKKKKHHRILSALLAGERYRRLPSLRILHLDDLDIIRRMHAPHRPGRDEDELLANGISRRFDHFPHADFAVDAVHENVELIQTSDRRSHGIPQREKKADCGEGFFAAGQGFGFAAFAAFGWVGLDLEVEFLFLVVGE